MNVVNVDDWVKENESFFVPPVCNRMMHNDQLKIMFVGGPNERKDFHLEEGEELFYQLKGDMCLKVLEMGKFRDIHITEGDMFLLPARVYHSPQRKANTVGLVIERQRLSTETDCVRYFVDGSTDVLFERWFHCSDLVKDLPPLIREFFASEECKTGRPSEGSVPAEGPYTAAQIMLESAFNFKRWVDEHAAELEQTGELLLFGKPLYRSSLIVYGRGTHLINTGTGEMFVWQLTGDTRTHLSSDANNERVLHEGDTLRMLPNTEFTLLGSPGSQCFTFAMQPPCGAL